MKNSSRKSGTTTTAEKVREAIVEAADASLASFRAPRAARLTRALRSAIGLVVSAEYDHDLAEVRASAEEIAERVGCWPSDVLAYADEREVES